MGKRLTYFRKYLSKWYVRKPTAETMLVLFCLLCEFVGKFSNGFGVKETRVFFQISAGYPMAMNFLRIPVIGRRMLFPVFQTVQRNLLPIWTFFVVTNRAAVFKSLPSRIRTLSYLRVILTSSLSLTRSGRSVFSRSFKVPPSVSV